jgi:hypothetical protein
MRPEVSGRFAPPLERRILALQLSTDQRHEQGKEPVTHPLSEPPELRELTVATVMVWHERTDADPSARVLRQIVAEAVKR